MHIQETTDTKMPLDSQANLNEKTYNMNRFIFAESMHRNHAKVFVMTTSRSTLSSHYLR